MAKAGPQSNTAERSSYSPCTDRLHSKMLSAGHTGHMLRDIGQRLDTQSCGWEQCEKYMPCVKHWVQRTVEECQVPQCPLHLIQIRTVPSLSVCGLREASYPKYLGTVVVGLEPRGGQEEKPPSRQVQPSPPPG